MLALDGRGRNASAVVIIEVTRDEQVPVFNGVPAVVTVSENLANASEVLRLNATDADLSDQLVFEMTGLFPASQFFAVERSTGVVRTISSLQNDPLKLFTYTVSSKLYTIQNLKNLMFVFMVKLVSFTACSCGVRHV